MSVRSGSPAANLKCARNAPKSAARRSKRLISTAATHSPNRQLRHALAVRMAGSSAPRNPILTNYAAAGRRISKTGSGSAAAQVGQAQETPITATYDPANRMQTVTLNPGQGAAAGEKTYLLAYDTNGNLTTRTDQANPSDQTVYTWDSRNRLTSLTQPGQVAAFSYDLFNRRIAKTVNGQTTRYVYDGVQAVAEIAPSGVRETVATGLAMDEMIGRYAQGGAKALTLLTDALGSVIAQVQDQAGSNTQALQGGFAYTLYGETIATGFGGTLASIFLLAACRTKGQAIVFYAEGA